MKYLMVYSSEDQTKLGPGFTIINVAVEGLIAVTGPKVQCPPVPHLVKALGPGTEQEQSQSALQILTELNFL